MAGSLTKKIYLWWKERRFLGLKEKPTQDVFSEIYKKNIWGGKPGTFYSGTGTHNPNTTTYITNIANFINSHQVKKLVEIGCGDFTITKEILQQVKVDYTGGDVVKELIAHHQEKYQNSNTRFCVLNAIEDKLPEGDMVIIRQVLQHLNNEQIQKILLKLGQYKYAVITEHVPVTADAEFNLDKIQGPHIRMRVNSGVFIDKPPFNCKNVTVLFEYRQDDMVKKKLVPAVIRTYLIKQD
jgi:Methyltransferase domain